MKPSDKEIDIETDSQAPLNPGPLCSATSNGQRWKLDNNKKLENKEGVWTSDDLWIFKTKDDDLIYVENTSKTKVLGATSDGKAILEDFEEGKAHQLWRKGELDAENYFTLENSGVPKVLTAISESSLEIKDPSNDPIDILRDGVKDEDLGSEGLIIHFDFNLIKTVKNQSKDEKNKENEEKSFEHITLLHKQSREILIEPLVAVYLNLKWQSLKHWWFAYRLLFFLAFGVCLTLLISFIVEMNSDCEIRSEWNETVIVNSTKCSNGYSNLTIMELVEERSERQDVMIAFYINVTINATRFWILYAFTFFGIILVFFAESSEAYRDGPWRYFTSKENWLDFGNLFCAGMCLFLTGTNYKDTAVWFGSTSVLLSWLIIALSIGDMPIVGNWVYLLGNTVKKVTTFLLVFMPLLFGFGLRFRFMFPDKVFGFLDSLYHAIFMLVNTFKYQIEDFGKNIDKDTNGYEYWVEIGTYGTFILALIVLTISFQNILVGLAVNLANEAFIDAKYHRRWSMAQNLRGIRKFLNCCRKELYYKHVPEEAFLRCNKNSSWTHIWKQSEGKRKFVLIFWNAVVLGEYLVYDTKSDAIDQDEKGKIIGTIPQECVEDAIKLVKERNKEREQRKNKKIEKDKKEERRRKKKEENQKVQDENQKAKMERERILELLENVLTALQNK